MSAHVIPPFGKHFFTGEGKKHRGEMIGTLARGDTVGMEESILREVYANRRMQIGKLTVTSCTREIKLSAPISKRLTPVNAPVFSPVALLSTDETVHSPVTPPGRG